MVEDQRTYPLVYALELDYKDYLWDNQNEKYENDMKCFKKFYAFDANGITDLCDKYLRYFIDKKVASFLKDSKQILNSQNIAENRRVDDDLLLRTERNFLN